MITLCVCVIHYEALMESKTKALHTLIKKLQYFACYNEYTMCKLCLNSYCHRMFCLPMRIRQTTAMVFLVTVSNTFGFTP